MLGRKADVQFKCVNWLGKTYKYMKDESVKKQVYQKIGVHTYILF